jgi:formate dehydrogenase iron-sulfur subunit
MALHEQWSEDRASEIISQHSGKDGPLLPVLQALQEAFGCVPEAAVVMVAEALNLSRAEVHGVVTFYHDFRREPAGRRILKLCRAEACQAAGGDALAARAQARLGAAMGTTAPDGSVTLEPVYCLGLCATAPSAMIDGRVVGRLDQARLDAELAPPRYPLPGTAGVPPAHERAGGTPAVPEGSLRVFIPGDAGAVAVGADEVARALRQAATERAIALEIVRTGSRGLYWLEPLIEVATPVGRVGYGPVTAADAAGLLDAALAQNGAHPLRHGVVDDIPWLKRQTRLTFARCGVIDPLSIADYRAHGGFRALERALSLGPDAIIEEVVQSGLRGRGGAGFPTGIKWRTVAQTAAAQKYIVCNADEGDSGTFADRMIMEGDPFVLIEGMTIAGIAVGATRGYVYIRSEYPHAITAMEAALAAARRESVLGPRVAGSPYAFDIEVRAGAGAYVCGEETSLLESIEGRRGIVRAKPPLPAHKGLFGRPTVINNVLSLASVPIVLAEGAARYRDFGMGRSRGTMPIQLAGNVKHGGLFETAFGVTLGELVDDIGGGAASGRPVRAVQVGGPLGAYFPRALFDTPFDYEAFAARDGLIGHGGVVVFDDTVDMARQARFAMEFCALESCGKCTPCRIGSTRGVETIDRIIRGDDRAANLTVLEDLCHTMKFGSLCALGGFTPYPVMSALTHIPEDFGAAPSRSSASFRGATEGGEPGIHSPRPVVMDSGLAASRRPGMTQTVGRGAAE